MRCIRCYPCHKTAVFPKTTVCGYDMQMRVKIKKIPECLNSNNGSRFRVLQRYPVFQIARQHLPGALAKLGQKTTIIQKIWPKTLWKAKYPHAYGGPVPAHPHKEILQTRQHAFDGMKDKNVFSCMKRGAGTHDDRCRI